MIPIEASIMSHSPQTHTSITFPTWEPEAATPDLLFTNNGRIIKR